MRLVSAVATLLLVSAPAFALGTPASRFCQGRHGTISLVPGANGSERAFCVLPDGLRVDAWVYFRNTHRTTH